MSFIYNSLITAIAFVGVLSNLQMLSNCYKNKASNTFLEERWTVVFCQAVYQVFVLVTNTVSSWTGFNALCGEHDCDHCNGMYTSVATFMVFSVSGSLAFFANEPRSVPCRKRELIPSYATNTTAVLALVLAAFVTIRCRLNRFCEDTLFYLMAINLITTVTIVLLLHVAFGSCKPQLDAAAPKVSWIKFCVKNKGTALFVALFIACFGVMLTFQKVLNLLLLNAAVGIALPMAFNDLNGSGCETEKEIGGLVISKWRFLGWRHFMSSRYCKLLTELIFFMKFFVEVSVFLW